MDAGQAAHLPADDQALDPGAERREMRRLQMGIERRLVVVDFVQDHAVRLLAIERDVELPTTRLPLDRAAGVRARQLQELLELVRLDLELGVITNGPRCALWPAIRYLPGE
jgi:hypothetical protein